MFCDRQPIEQDVVLGTDSQTAPDQVYVLGDVESVDESGSGGWGEETGEHGHGGGLAGSVVAQESRDLALVHVEIELVHGYLPPFGILKGHQESVLCDYTTRAMRLINRRKTTEVLSL